MSELLGLLWSLQGVYPAPTVYYHCSSDKTSEAKLRNPCRWRNVEDRRGERRNMEIEETGNWEEKVTVKKSRAWAWSQLSCSFQKGRQGGFHWENGMWVDCEKVSKSCKQVLWDAAPRSTPQRKLFQYHVEVLRAKESRVVLLSCKPFAWPSLHTSMTLQFLAPWKQILRVCFPFYSLLEENRCLLNECLLERLWKLQ